VTPVDGINSALLFDRGLYFPIPIVRRVTILRQGDFQVRMAYDESAAHYGLDARENKSIASFKIEVAPQN
jgi:hypothetical protein